MWPRKKTAVAESLFRSHGFALSGSTGGIARQGSNSAPFLWQVEERFLSGAKASPDQFLSSCRYS